MSTSPLPEISDAYMRATLPSSRDYSVVVLSAGPNFGAPEAQALIWEHVRRNFALRAAGLLAIVCPIMDDSPLCGVGIFAADLDETTRLMADDPGVRAGVFTFAVHPSRSFPGDRLPPRAPAPR